MKPTALVAAALLSALAASPAAAETVDEDLRPGGTVLSTLFPSAEVETFRVAAPAGSVLLVDLRPAAKGAFTPSLSALRTDGSPAPVPAARRNGRVRASIPFDGDGVVTLRVGSAKGGGDYRLRTRLRAPGGADLSGSVEDAAGAALPFFAPPGSRAKATVRGVPGGTLVPRILAVSGPGGDALPEASLPGATGESWIGLTLDSLGPWTLAVGGDAGTTGPFTARVRWRVARGPDEDHRDAADLGALRGPYTALLADPSAAGSFLTGGATFDGKGRIATDLGSLGMAPDAASPLGFSLGVVPLGPSTGSYWTDGARARVALDLGAGGKAEAEFTVAAGGSVLYAGAAAGETSPAVGLMLERGGTPTVAALAGSWLYVNALQGSGGASTVEIGTLTLTSSGGASGLGARSEVTLVGGTPTPGAQTPILRSGSFQVAADGTVTVTTRANFFGPEESWSAGVVFRQDILAGGGPGAAPASEARFLLRQGTGLTDADVAGDYLHLGLALGAAPTVRSGILAFDGAGGFSGTETVSGLAGGTPETGVPATGTYSVNTSGIASFAPDGGASGTGIVGPDAAYLFTVSLGTGGIGIDVLLGLR